MYRPVMLYRQNGELLLDFLKEKKKKKEGKKKRHKGKKKKEKKLSTFCMRFRKEVKGSNVRDEEKKNERAFSLTYCLFRMTSIIGNCKVNTYFAVTVITKLS